MACPLAAQELPLTASESQQLEALLTRLSLADLQIHRLERALAQPQAADARLATARRLADAYAGELIAVAESAARFEQLERRLQRLLGDVPQAKSPAVEVVLLQAEYQRAEALILRWFENPRDRAPLAEAATRLAKIAPLIAEHYGQRAAAVEKLSAALEDEARPAERMRLEQELAREQTLAARAAYFAGWANYYLGISRQDPAAARAEFTAAREHFCKLLELSPEADFARIEAAELGLESGWRARSVIGLALAEIALDRQAAASSALQWLADSSVPPALREQAAYWHVQGLLNVGRPHEAATLVAREVDRFSSSPSPGKSSLALAAVRAGVALDTASAERDTLIVQGLRGLARMRQFETLDKLLGEFQLDEGPLAHRFHVAWVAGRRAYLAAEKEKSDAAFRAAAERLERALASPEAAADTAAASQARYYLAWCRFRLGELDRAARTFQEAAVGLRTPLPDLAAQAAWMHCTVLAQLAAKEPRRAAAAIAALAAYKEDYPATSEAQRVDLLITRLRQAAGKPEDALRDLAAIGPGDPNYALAQFEICQLQHQRWAKAKTEPAKAPPLATELLAAVERCLALARQPGDEERRVKVALLALDVLLSERTPDWDRSRSLLAAIGGDAARLDPALPLASEYQYRRLQAAQAEGDEAALAKAAQALAEHGRGTPYELAGLIVVAKAADEAVKSASAAERPMKLAAAAEIYTRIIALVGDSPEALKSNKTALAASARLAQYDLDRGAWREAAARLSRLVEATGNDRRFLRQAAVAHFESGQFAAALEYWRKLLAGLPGGSDEWLEAKYHQLRCLQQTDPAGAKKVWDQFRLLYPEVKSAEWTGKFAALAQDFPPPAPR